MRARTATLLNIPAVLLALALVIGACGDDETVVGGPAVSGDSGDSGEPALDGRQFWSTSVLENGVDRPLAQDTRISVRFDNGDISASAGCNSMGGRYRIDNDGRLTVREMASTEIGCDPERHAQDEFVATVLNARPRLTLSGDHLVVATDSVRIELLDAEVADPDRPILQTRWVVNGFIQGEFAIAKNVEPGLQGWIEFSKDSRLTGFNGCVEFIAPIEVSDGTDGGSIEGDGEIRFGEVIAEDCEAPSDYSDAFDALFDTGSTVYTINGPYLDLVNSQGNGVGLVADE